MIGSTADFERGRAAYTTGRNEEVLATYLEVIDADPCHTQALHQLGVLHLERDEPGEVIAWFKRWSSPEISHDLGRTLRRQRRTSESTVEALRALLPEAFAAMEHSQTVQTYLDWPRLRRDFLIDFDGMLDWIGAIRTRNLSSFAWLLRWPGNLPHND